MYVLSYFRIIHAYAETGDDEGAHMTRHDAANTPFCGFAWHMVYQMRMTSLSSSMLTAPLLSLSA